jgi:ArsR family transcriptional regulator
MRLMATGEAREVEHPPMPGNQQNTSGPDEVCLCRLTEILGLSAPTISRHMAVLRDAGMVTARRQGQWVHFAIHTDALKDLADQLLALKSVADETLAKALSEDAE